MDSSQDARHGPADARIPRRTPRGRSLVAIVSLVVIGSGAGCGSGGAAIDTATTGTTARPVASDSPSTRSGTSLTPGTRTGTSVAPVSSALPDPGTSARTSSTPAPTPTPTTVPRASCLEGHHGPSEFGPTGLPGDPFEVEISGSGSWDGRDGAGTLRLVAEDITVTLTLTDTSKGRVVHRASLTGEATAQIRIEPTATRSQRVVISSADTSRLTRSITTTIDGASAPTPPELQGLLDLMHGTLTVDCAVGSGMMFASVIDGSGFKTAWAVVR